MFVVMTCENIPLFLSEVRHFLPGKWAHHNAVLCLGVPHLTARAMLVNWAPAIGSKKFRTVLGQVAFGMVG